MARHQTRVLLIFWTISFLVTKSTADNCTCVPFNRCDTENSEGIGLLDVRNFQNSTCPGHFETCCNSLDIIQPEISSNEEREEIKLDSCGYQNSGFFPWSAALLLREKNRTTFTYKCGVSLINRKAVITAAHCLDQEKIEKYYHLRLGNVLRTALKIIIHPQYNPSSLHNDLALIILNSPVNLSRKIGTICIPPEGKTSKSNSKCSTAAWVKTFNNKKSFSYLKLITLPLISHEKCEKVLRTTRLGLKFQLHSSFLCAGGLDNSVTCGGDGGSPLVCPVEAQPGRFHQMGIVSWGIGCGENKVPGVYVKLSTFRNWIDEEMTKNGLDISSYRY